MKINFSLDADATGVKMWTDSFLSGVNFDPITAVWAQTNTGWSLIGQNDDNPHITPGQTYFDSGLTFANLVAGNYLFIPVHYCHIQQLCQWYDLGARFSV